MSTVDLPEIPDLGSLYRAAVSHTVRMRSKRYTAAPEVPDVRVRVAGLTVDPQHSAEYARACGLPVASAVPLTYPFVLTFPLAMTVMTQREFPVGPVGVVHVANSIEALRPIVPGSTVDLEVWTSDVRPHRAGWVITLVSEVRESATGTVLWRQRSGMLSRGTAAHAEDARPEDFPPVLDSGPLTVEPAVLPVISRLPATAARTSAYAEVSGDKNPIHISTLGAKAFGFSSVIAHGMWSATVALSPLEGRAPSPMGPCRYDVEFRSPVLLPRKLSTRARALAATGTPGQDGAWELALTSARKDDSAPRVHLLARVTPVEDEAARPASHSE